MSVQGAADAVKDAVDTVAEKVQDATIGDKSAEGSTPNLLLDEVTGEKVSKSELKKRQKAREREAKKAEAAATKQAPPPPKKKAGSEQEEEAKLNPNVSVISWQCGSERSLTWCDAAILRDPVTRHQAHEGDPEPESIPSQVQGHIRPPQLPERIWPPQEGRACAG